MAAPGLILSPSYQTITPRPAFGPAVVIPENSSPCNVAEPSPTKPAAPCADSVAANTVTRPTDLSTSQQRPANSPVSQI
jgi:hypothetical protein